MTSSPTKDEHNNENQTPSSTAISGFSRVYEDQRDENLPEVYVDDSPQAVSKEEYHAAAAFNEAQSPKYSVAYDDSPKTALPPEYEAPGDLPPGASAAADAAGPPETQPSKDQKICGIGRKTFFIILAVLLIVIAAAVGGGVGGAVASSASKSGSSGDPDDSDDGGDPPPTATSDSPSGTATASETPSATAAEFLNNQTYVTDTFAFQGFTETEYDGNATDIFSEETGIDFDFGIASYVWAPQTTGCCLTFCMNSTDDGNVGWLCSARKQPKASDTFRRIFVWCGKEQSEKNAICSD